MYEPNMAGATALYNKLNNLYGSPYEDNREERQNSLTRLIQALKKDVDPEMMFRKIEQINLLQGNYKQKLGTIINGSFWNKNYIQNIEYKPFNTDD
jgi:hypothetical protein